MIASVTDHDELQLNAYCDGELDLASAAAFERRLAEDETLRAQYTRLMSLRQGFRSLPQSDVPAGLRARIQSTLDAERPGRARVLRQRSWPLRALAAAAVFGAVISSSVMMTIAHLDQREGVASQVVAGHIRSLLAPQPFDVASSDRHTVKPWFTARLPESPQVPDLAAQGFTGIGAAGAHIGVEVAGDAGQIDGRRGEPGRGVRFRRHWRNLARLWRSISRPLPLCGLFQAL